jgi:acyl-CoA thioester hydrolase
VSAHQFAIRVYYEDTDAAGIVYYANYLKFAERARTEMMRDLGFEHERMRREHDLMLAVRRCTIDFIMPARLDDLLTVATTVVSAVGAAFEIEQEVRRDDAVLARLALRIACLNSAGRPRRLPAALVDAAQPVSRHASTTVAQHAR